MPYSSRTAHLASPPIRHEAQRITRNLIKAGLGAPRADEEDVPYHWLGPVPQAAVETTWRRAFDDDSMPEEAGQILSDTRSWLETLVEEERSKADWSTEYRFERSTLGAGIISTEDQNTLDRVCQGEEPRPFECEDILAPLRLQEHVEHSTSTVPQLLEETFADQLELLYAWNRKVAPMTNLDKERNELYRRLEERCQIMAQVEKGFRTGEHIDGHASHVRRALRNFRPEIKGFEHKSCINVLTVIVAHFRIARPDIEVEMRDKMIEAILREERLTVRKEEDFDARNDQLEARLQTAYESGNGAVVESLRKEKRTLAINIRTICTEKTIDRLKEARRLVRQRNLVELQDLVVPQAGLLSAAHDRFSMPYSLLQETLKSEEVVKRIAEHLSNAEAACDADLANVATMHDLDWSCLQRTKKSERSHRERKNDPEKWNMMIKVVNDSKMMSQIPDVVSSHMTRLNESLQLALEVATEQYRELGGWERALLDEDTKVDPELALVGKLMVDAKRKEMWRVGSKTPGGVKEKEEGVETGAEDPVL
jgi:hypothetical protein